MSICEMSFGSATVIGCFNGVNPLMLAFKGITRSSIIETAILYLHAKHCGQEKKDA